MMQKKQIKKKTPSTNRKRVSLTFEARWAQAVALVGDFNKWNPRTHPMKKDDKGTWTRVLILKPGTYEYKFLVDGEWKNDPHNEHAVANCFGTLNNCLTVRL